MFQGKRCRGGSNGAGLLRGVRGVLLPDAHLGAFGGRLQLHRTDQTPPSGAYIGGLCLVLPRRLICALSDAAYRFLNIHHLVQLAEAVLE